MTLFQAILIGSVCLPRKQTYAVVLRCNRGMEHDRPSIGSGTDRWYHFRRCNQRCHRRSYGTGSIHRTDHTWWRYAGGRKLGGLHRYPASMAAGGTGEQAVALAVPLSMLGLGLFNFIMTINAYFPHMGDKAAAKGDGAGIHRATYLAAAPSFILRAGSAMLICYLGTPVAEISDQQYAKARTSLL